eukprot:TRINITY_DN5652_c0_g1_i4.p1 TRINITY_DN5652_c0_g1~~TRINITY_DN5652_c0_g1_i4.p1  ORF type:complete len:352 (+),score=112.93 TRINITY_DN5652_c0_g1_i4:98-1057(+)
MARVTEEMRLVSGGFRMAYKHWRPAGGAAATQRMLCYPGWLDNAGSFDNIAPLLVQQGWELVCPDPPGCGYSQHLPPYGTYNQFEEVPLALGLLEDLGWTTGPQFTVLAHSRGAGVGIMIAGTFPEYVKCLLLVDSALVAPNGAIVSSKFTAPAIIRRAVKWDRKNAERATRIFDTFEEIVDASENNKVFRKSRSSATNITRRHVKQLGDGRWQYTHDVRQYGQSQKMYPDLLMMDHHNTAVQCPVLLLLAADMDVFKMTSDLRKAVERRKSFFKDFVERKVPGGHHVHSDDPQATLNAMQDFLDAAAATTTMCRTAKL